VSVGDVFNHAVVSNTIVNTLGECLLRLSNKFYFVWGNHDLEYHLIKTWKKTSLGVLLQNNPVVQHISQFKNDYGYPIDYQDWNTPIKDNNSDILLSHKAIVNHSLIPKNSALYSDATFSTQVESPELKKYKLIICGHWHKRYFFRHNDITVINPGPVMRQTVIDNCIPEVVLVDTDTTLFKRITLKCAKPFEEVISTVHLDKAQAIEKTAFDFLNVLSAKQGKSKSFVNVVTDLLNSNKLKPELNLLLRDVVETAMETKNKD
jgi:predicted phosphodiesterase